MAFLTKPEADLLLEVSWETCNKVGGIYTVLLSKTNQIIKYYKNYYLIGPYLPDSETLRSEFKESQPDKNLKIVFQELSQQGINCHFGEWMIEGRPKIILVDFSGIQEQVNQIKTELWEDYSIDSLSAGFDFTEPVVWSYACSKLIEGIAAQNTGKVVAHFHEWLSAAALLYLKKHKSKVATVFTTHATTLGRTLANNGIDLYGLFKEINSDKEASKYNIQAKHQLEKQSARYCDVLTTVSEITSQEVEYFLGRKPDILLPNGLDITKYPTFEEAALKHRIQKERIREFCLYYFFPYYSFSIENTIFYFIASRYEFYNKGIGEFIKALGVLNRKLQKEQSQQTIVAFFFVPTQVNDIKPEIIEARENYRDIKDSLEEISEELEDHLLYSLMSDMTPSKDTPFLKDEEIFKEINNKLLKLKRKGLPPLSTHNLFDSQDAILRGFKEQGLQNKESDCVKVIFYPTYLTGSDGLLNLNYYESIEGCHLGVFPSLYEPWGYTPLETAVVGVASITTDVSGLGRFLMKTKRDKNYPGIFILNRFGRQEQRIVKDLSDLLYKFAKLSKEERIKNKIQARGLASLLDWQVLIEYYIKAHNKALKNNQ